MNKYEKKIKDSIYRFLYHLRVLRSNIFIFLSRNVLKNEGGLDLYLIGKAKHFFIRKMCKKDLEYPRISDAHKDVVSFLHQNKFAKINLDISDELLEKIQGKANEYIENNDYSYIRGTDQGNTEEKYFTRAMKNIVGNVPEVKDILSPELENVLKEYFGTNIGVTSVLFWRNYHVPQDNENKIVFSNDWHNDNIEPTELKLFVNITDVTEEHGPLHVISHQTSKKLFTNKAFKGRKKHNDLQQLENKEHIVKHTGKAGSAVLAHASYCLHRADIPAEGNYRDMLEFQFHPAVKPLADDWDKKPLKYQ